MTLQTIQRTLTIGSRQIRLRIPADPEQVLLEAVAGEKAGSRSTDPYWGLLWDAAPVTASRILNTTFPTGQPALELGCGVGLAGIAALMAGLDVTFSDLVPAAVELAVQNAQENGYPDAKGLVLDWCSPPQQQFSFIFASDVLYDHLNHEPLLNVLHQMLSPDGSVWLGDAGRKNAPLFLERARTLGWMVELTDQSGKRRIEPTHVEFQLICLTRSVKT